MSNDGLQQYDLSNSQIVPTNSASSRVEIGIMLLSRDRPILPVANRRLPINLQVSSAFLD